MEEFHGKGSHHLPAIREGGDSVGNELDGTSSHVVPRGPHPGPDHRATRRLLLSRFGINRNRGRPTHLGQGITLGQENNGSLGVTDLVRLSALCLEPTPPVYGRP